MRIRPALVALALLASRPALAAPAAAPEHSLRVELNSLQAADKSCNMTFVIENKTAALESLKLDLVLFNTEQIVHRRVVIEMGPVRAGRTIVKSFPIDTQCAQIGAVLVNDITACVPGEPNACLDGLDLSSRVKNVRLYK
jgi:hypothetical protein